MAAEVLNIKTINDYAILENHVKIISTIQDQLASGKNLADIIWDMEAVGKITKGQIPSVVHTLLIEKHGYSSLSFNLSATLSDWEKIHQVVRTWDNFDTILAYYHPQLDISLINPSNADHWDRIESLAAYELMVIFAKAKNSDLAEKENQFLKDFKAICSGQTAKDDHLYKSGRIAQTPAPTSTESKTTTKAAPQVEQNGDADASAEGSKKKRITPKYAVQVTNELFHNGNVEAWRNIIESYQRKHQGNTVLLFHNGQRIKHISSLFKWGKVKVGDSILFSVVGEEIKDVAKLKKYLYEGASHNFKYFVKKDVNAVLTLF